MLGVFGKLPGDEPVKTRLQARLTRAEAERFYLASLADTLETACRVVDRPVLFLASRHVAHLEAEPVLLAAGVDPAVWSRVQVEHQYGDDLGERLERALDFLCTVNRGGMIIGSDSPSLEAKALRRANTMLESADVVLGPTSDGGYYAIGFRRRYRGLLHGIAWSTNRVLAETRARAEERGLHVELLEPWTDVDRPEDLEVLASQIADLRASGDGVTARHTAQVLATLGIGRPPLDSRRC
jgi:uncharacterized protein